MKKLLGIIFLILLLNSNVYSKDGSGNLRFTANSFNSFLAYLRGDGSDIGGVMMSSGMPIGFAINQKGNNTYYYYCPKKYGDNCMPGGHIKAQSDCTNRSKKRGEDRCFVFAKGRKIVWDSVSIKIPKKPTNEQFKEIFAKNDWYGDTKSKDISKPKITKKKKKETKKVTKNSSDLINKLKDLKELRDNDVLTDEEFLKAKKKLLE
jgi:hypothetical protein